MTFPADRGNTTGGALDTIMKTSYKLNKTGYPVKTSSTFIINRLGCCSATDMARPATGCSNTKSGENLPNFIATIHRETDNKRSKAQQN